MIPADLHPLIHDAQHLHDNERSFLLGELTTGVRIRVHMGSQGKTPTRLPLRWARLPLRWARLRLRPHPSPAETQSAYLTTNGNAKSSPRAGNMQEARVSQSGNESWCWWQQSHFLHTPLQLDAYRTSWPANDTEERAWRSAIWTLVDWYKQAVRQGHQPEESWLVPNTEY
jgi:hypothetical protein